MKKILAMLTISSPLLLTGCIPAYQLPKNTHAIARVNASAVNGPEIKVANQWQRLIKDQNGNTFIPAGRGLTVGNNFDVSQDEGDWVEEISCFPKVSFLPRQKNEYFFDFHIKKGTCFFMVLKRPKNSTQPYRLDTTVIKEI